MNSGVDARATAQRFVGKGLAFFGGLCLPTPAAGGPSLRRRRDAGGCGTGEQRHVAWMDVVEPVPWRRVQGAWGRMFPPPPSLPRSLACCELCPCPRHGRTRFRPQ